MAEKYDSLSHTKYYTRYHIIFTPKYRRKIIYNSLRKDIGEYLSKLCKYKGVKLIEGHLMSDHVHMLVSIPLKLSVSQFMGYLKGKSTTMIYEQFPELKYKYKQREFWCKGQYVDTVGKNEGRIAEYIKHQLEEDRLGEQLSIPEITRNKKK